ncbi:bacillithiol biosynthesis cysteine-adding enzyme BshC [Kyrpidia spormannii]|uniref:Cysteine ligase BshC n=1 Tax=Kyrpidia spormannii TaxID=2055160 RepID=A0ACA8ZAB1_9BACL|nr:bacillithiol biosynthesis cysteine-adding enzyme BshC [Kyrpidia spormannii]CAB3393479.1 putative cysteine ligase BshC [Kyrpidia spormannii]
MRVEPCYVKQHPPMAEDYVSHFSRVQELFDYDPRSNDVWEQRVRFLDRQSGPRADRHQLVQALSLFNQRIENAPEALAAIRSLEDERTLVVVGGQQACLFTGPLLVIYKAITIVRTARRLSRELRRPVTPVFWIAGEDHDFDEVNHVYYLTQNLDIRKIQVDHPTGKKTSVSRIALNRPQWEEVVDQFQQSLMDTEFKAEIVEKLAQLAGRSTTLVDCFARIMAWLFGPQGLVLVDSGDPNLRCIERPMFEQFIAWSREMNEALWNGKRKVESLGYAAQLDLKEGSANLFVDHEGERTLLYRDQYGGFTDKKGHVRFTKQELVDLAKNDPVRFSNNAATRPIMQEFLFPVLGTILGPGEIAYWGLLREAFQLFELQMPVIVPRLQFTILEPSVQKQMQTYGILLERALDDVQYIEHKKKAWLEEQGALHLKDRFDHVKRQVVELYTPLLDLVSNIDPGMRDLGKTNLDKILKHITFLETRAMASYEAQFETALRRFERIRQNVTPMGKLQDRVYNVFTYLNKHGQHWLTELTEAPLADNRTHHILYLS